MFYYISGKLAKLDAGYAVVDAGGVGYKLTVSRSTYEKMPHRLTVSEAPDVKLYTYMAVREDGIEMFGFADEEELSAFKMLIGVSGVGPKAAISILSTLSPEKLALSVCTDDRKTISQANGIGAKTAARIILELKDKLKAESFGEISSDALQGDETASGGAMSAAGKLSDAQDALAVLGYSRAEANRALQSIDTSSLELDDIIRLALKKLMK